MDPNPPFYYQHMLTSPNSPPISQSENQPFGSQPTPFSYNPYPSSNSFGQYNPMYPTFSTQCSIGGEASTQPKKKEATKRYAWTIDDDNVLVSAYLNTSKDSIIGIDQSASCFWGKITSYYNDNKSGGSNRDDKSCKNRWHVVNGQVSKFVGCYNEATTRKKSGESESDVIFSAHKLYESSTLKKFNLEHAWYLLRGDPKWMPVGDESASKRSRINERGNYSSSSSAGTPGTPGTPSTTPMASTDGYDTPPVPVLIRPIGAKAAKRKAKEKAKAMPSVAEGVNEGGVSAAQRMESITLFADSQLKMAEAMQATARANEATARAKQYRTFLKLAAKNNRTEYEERALAGLDAEMFPKEV